MRFLVPPVEIGHPFPIVLVNPNRRSAPLANLIRQPEMIGMLVREHDLPDRFDRKAARGQPRFDRRDASGVPIPVSTSVSGSPGMT